MQKNCLCERTKDAHDLPLPTRQTDVAAGYDLYANVANEVIIKKGARCLIPTGVKLALPFGFEGQIRPRSGLALKHGITVLNAPGTIDADYRGEVKVLLINHGENDFTVKRGERIAQLIIAPIAMITLEEVQELPQSVRGCDGFGSTGV